MAEKWPAVVAEQDAQSAPATAERPEDHLALNRGERRQKGSIREANLTAQHKMFLLFKGSLSGAGLLSFVVELFGASGFSPFSVQCSVRLT